MAYLNNSVVTVDAILTTKGRELLAKSDGSFRITQFALADDEIDGIVQYHQNKVMTAVPGTTDAFYLSILQDAIPFNFGDGSYNYVLKNSSDVVIPFGQGDWVVDTTAGVLYFYNGNPGSMPPKISFYRYIGTKGVTSSLSLVSTTEKFIVDSLILSNGYIDLANTPNISDHINVIYNGMILDEDTLYESISDGDYFISTNRITFNFDLDLDNKIIVKYKY